jgi:hypothetical protein
VLIDHKCSAFDLIANDYDFVIATYRFVRNQQKKKEAFEAYCAHAKKCGRAYANNIADEKRSHERGGP